MAKVFALFLLALLAISMLHTTAFGLVKPPKWLKPVPSGKPPKFGPGSLKNFKCPTQCLGRCGKTQYPKPCMLFCMKCCKKCKCVPAGNNKADCPCYYNC